MAKLTLADVANLLGNPTSAANTINANNALVETALENTLSRDGTTPNQMEADIDMNNNDLLNVKRVNTDSLSIGGVDVATTVALRADIYATKSAATAATIPASITALRTNGSVTEGDGLGGLYIDTNNGSSDTFVSSGDTARTWYRAADVSASRLIGAADIRDFLVLPEFIDETLGFSQTRRHINNVLSGAVYDSSLSVLNGDAPNYLIVRFAKHTVAASGVPRAFGVLTQILADVKNFEFAGESSLEDKVAQTVAVDFVGFKSSNIRFSTAAGTLASSWAGYDELHDQTGLRSSLSGGALRGREITMIASAPDDSGIRYGLDVVHSKLPSYAGTDTEFAVGVRVVNAAYYGASFGKTVVGAAFDANGEDPFATGSSIQIGLRAYISSIGVLVDGNPVNGSFVAEIFGSTSIMKLGMKAVNSSAGQIQFTSQNNAGTQKKAFSMDGGLSDPTTGTEDGRFSMVAMIAGADTEVFAAFPEGDASNPIFIRVGGAMKKLTIDGGGFIKGV